MNLRGSAAHSGLSGTDSQVEVPWSTITGVAFREVSNALDEFGQELDDGLSVLIANESGSLCSVETRPVWTTSDDHHTVDDDDGTSTSLDEYVVRTTSYCDDL